RRAALQALDRALPLPLRRGRVQARRAGRSPARGVVRHAGAGRRMGGARAIPAQRRRERPLHRVERSAAVAGLRAGCHLLHRGAQRGAHRGMDRVLRRAGGALARDSWSAATLGEGVRARPRDRRDRPRATRRTSGALPRRPGECGHRPTRHVRESAHPPAPARRPAGTARLRRSPGSRQGGRMTSAPATLTRRQTTVAISGLKTGMLLAALDQTIVATALKTIVESFHGLYHYALVAPAYTGPAGVFFFPFPRPAWSASVAPVPTPRGVPGTFPAEALAGPAFWTVAATEAIAYEF